MFILSSVELVNMLFLLTNDSIVDTLMNFLALTVITEFDDFYFQTIKEEPLCKLISDGKY